MSAFMTLSIATRKSAFGHIAERQHLDTEHSLRVSFVGTFSTDGFEV